MTIHKAHVDRAWSLLRLLQRQRDWWDCSAQESGVEPQEVKEPPPDLLAQAQSHLHLPPAEASFPATQPFVDKLDISSEAVPVPCKAGAALEEPLKKGFGVRNVTVQEPPSFLSDRDIFRKTVLTGKTVVTFKNMTLRKTETQNGKTKKLSVSKQNWEQVMQAGFAKFPVGKVEHAGTPRVQVLFAAIPEEPAERIQFHNMLVDACQVSVRTWPMPCQNKNRKHQGRERRQTPKKTLRELKRRTKTPSCYSRWKIRSPSGGFEFVLCSLTHSSKHLFPRHIQSR